MRDKIKFESNVPVTVTLSYAVGKQVDGQFGPQIMYSLEGNQVMFVDMAVSQKINMLEPDAGESLVICKRPKNGSTPARWDVWLSPATEQLRAAKGAPAVPAEDPPSELERELAASVEQIRQREGALLTARRPTGTNGPVAVPVQRQMGTASVKATYLSAMTEFLLAAGRATRSAEITLGAEGGSVRFDSRDVAALATTLLIQAVKDGVVAW